MSNLKPEAGEPDPDQILKQVEIELAMKRAQRQESNARHGNLRALSLGFLFLVIFGAGFGFFLLMNSETMRERRAQAAERLSASPSPRESPR